MPHAARQPWSWLIFDVGRRRMNRQNYWIMFGIGIAAVPAFVLLNRFFPGFGDAWMIVAPLLIIALLPAIFTRVKKQAVPAKKSDLFGYAAILAFCVVVAVVAGIILK